MLWLLTLLGILCVLRGVSYNITPRDIRAILFSNTVGAVVWLMPTVLLYGLKSQFWFTWLPRLRVIVSLGLVYVFFVMLLSIYSSDITAEKMYNSADFLFVSAFLIIFSIYQPNKINIFIGCLGVIFLSAHMFINDERFALAYIGLMSLFYCIAIILEQHRFDIKIFIFYISSILLIISVVAAFQTPIFQKYFIKYFIHNEMWLDTRGKGGLAEAVTQGMSFLEYAFGRGILGKYAYGYHGWPPELYIRYLVEMGYKNIILKGGYVMLSSFLLLSMYAAYLGAFCSKNKLTRYLALIIIARLIIMTTAMIPRTGFEYFMFWIVVGGCLSPQLRALDDSTIKNNCETRTLVIKW